MTVTAAATIADVFRNVGNLFRQAGDGTPIQVGKQYSAQSLGQPPRVLFVPEPKGKAGPPLEVGGRQVASFTHSCAVYVLAAESGSDEGRFDAAYLLADRVVNALWFSAPGRKILEFGSFTDASPLDVDGPGAQVTFSFRFVRPVFLDAEIEAAAYALAQTPAPSPPDPDRLDGGSGLSFNTGTVTLANTRSS